MTTAVQRLDRFSGAASWILILESYDGKSIKTPETPKQLIAGTFFLHFEQIFALC